MVSTFIVVFDISKDGNPSGLEEKFKTYEGWAKTTESSWAIASEKKASEIRNELVPYIGSTGRIFILKSGKAAAWRNVFASNDWFKKNL